MLDIVDSQVTILSKILEVIPKDERKSQWIESSVEFLDDWEWSSQSWKSLKSRKKEVYRFLNDGDQLLTSNQYCSAERIDVLFLMISEFVSFYNLLLFVTHFIRGLLHAIQLLIL
jgi:hypothetical protein